MIGCRSTIFRHAAEMPSGSIDLSSVIITCWMSTPEFGWLKA